jgi:UDP-glucose 4-epimerase
MTAGATTRIEGRRALVVGGAGFVGSNLVRELLRCGVDHVLVIDNLLSAERENIPVDDRVTFVEASITDDAVLAGVPEDVELLFHLATFHGNQSSIADPLADHENNTLTTLKLLERAKDLPHLEKVVYASAGCTVAEKTYDEAAATDEDAPVSLWHDSPYQISKIVGEFYANYYRLRHGVPTVKARFQNVYGPGEVLAAGRWRGTAHTVWRNVTPTFVYKALRGEALPVDNGGIATRDFIYVEDIVAGLLACAERGDAGAVYNLASGVETSIRELAELINELTANPTPIAIAPARDWDRSGRRYGDPSKARSALGFEASVPLRDGLKQTIDWTRDNLAFIEACIARHRGRLAHVQLV